MKKEDKPVYVSPEIVFLKIESENPLLQASKDPNHSNRSTRPDYGGANESTWN